MKSFKIVEGLRYEEQEVPIPLVGEGQALVKLIAAAFNRRDVWIGQGKYPGIKVPSTMGADGCGIVVKVGHEKDRNWIGREVILNPSIEWGNDQSKQGPNFRVLGMPDDGTFADYIAISVDNLYPRPQHLNPFSAAALPLTGLTAYRAIFHYAQVKEGQNVLITGIGGGVSQMALQLCLALKAKVWVTSTKDWKLHKSKEMGALGGVNTQEAGWRKKLESNSGKFDVVIDSVGGDLFEEFLNLLDKGGVIVTYGASAGAPKGFDIFKLFFRQLRIQGTVMGSPSDFEGMLEFVNKHKIVPYIDSVRPFKEAKEALEQMKQSKQFGKLVLSLEPSTSP